MNSKYKLGIFGHSGVLSDDRIPVYKANMILSEINGLEKIAFEEWLDASKAPDGKVNRTFELIYNRLVSRDMNPIKPRMYEDAPHTLKKLKQREIKLAVLSNNILENIQTDLIEYNIFTYFNFVSGNPSPKEKRLIQACSRLKVPTDQTFLVEDTVDGLQAGYAAGIATFGITTGYHSREKLEAEQTAIKVVDSLTELLGYV